VRVHIRANEDSEAKVMTSAPAHTVPAGTGAAASGLDWWHAAWLAGLALGAGLLLISPIVVTGPILLALVAAAAPAVAGLLLARSNLGFAEPLTLILWTLGGSAAALLTGGVAGPLGVWHLAPLAAAAAMAKPRRLALGAALALGGLGLSIFATTTLFLPHPPPFAQAWVLGAIALLTSCLAFGAALVALQARVEDGESLTARATATLREALAEHPDLLVALYHSGRVAGAWGHALGSQGGAGLIGKSLALMAAEADRPAVEAAVTQAVSMGASQVRFTADGATHAGLELALRRASGTKLIGAVRDIRPQLAREAALEQARAEADAQNAGKSRFLANMSHELRTPLNAIMGFADIMKQKLFGPMPDRYADYPELIHESGGHLLELINDVLDVSKIEAERFELSLEDFDAREAINATLRLMRGQADRAGVHLRGVVPREPLEVMADRRALKQIALNLISNALKFTPKDGAVTVTVQAAGRDLELIVADTGAGIGAEDLTRLGRPYEQAGDSAQRARGTGLGLSLVRAMAELHGGEMRIESVLGEGTTVIVRMPVMEPAAVETPAE
jgi:cell cycle sensor histidine kinase DivJ